MNIINTTKISKFTALSALVLAFGAVVLVAPQAHASSYSSYGNDHGSSNHGGSYYGGASYYPSSYINLYTNYGHNSSSNSSSYSGSRSSSGSTVTVSNPVTVTVPVTVVGGTSYQPVVEPIYSTSPVVYNYPTYQQDYTPTYYNNTYAQLSGSCYARTTTVNAGQNVVWVANASGGDNNYTYSWSGTGGLYGYGPTLAYNYNNSGTMVANVSITSNGQSVSIPCNNDVIVNGYGYAYNYGTNYGGYYNNNSSLSATCSANTNSASIGQPVAWSANVTGGSGYYTYAWSGSNNLYGSGSTINATYNTPGNQYADVTVTSNGQSVTAQCSNSVVIGGGYGGNTNGLTIGCAADAATVHPGTPVTWSVEATGGNGNYTYAWSGTDGLAGSQSSVATTYETLGVKQAVVIVTSSDGLTGSKSCTPVSVVSGYRAGSGSTTVTPAPTNNSGLSAASLFSLANIPWGWVAVLIILVLFVTVMYMLFNKNKI